MITKSQKYCYQMAINDISDFKKRFPFADFSVIGRTWCGRALFSMSIGEGEECVLFAGGMRGHEWLTPAILFRFFERLCIAYENDSKLSAIKIRNALKERKIVIVPLLNPDSFEIANLGEEGAGCYRGLVARAAGSNYSNWNSNARGVDISKNFEYYFPLDSEISAPAPDSYQGPSAMSEPETKALVNLCDLNYFRHAILLSSPGEKIFFNSTDEHSDTAMMAQIFKTVCGYQISKKTEKEKSGGFCEWFSEKSRNPSFEIRVGNEDTQQSLGNAASIYDSIEEMLVLSAIM